MFNTSGGGIFQRLRDKAEVMIKEGNEKEQQLFNESLDPNRGQTIDGIYNPESSTTMIGNGAKSGGNIFNNSKIFGSNDYKASQAHISRLEEALPIQQEGFNQAIGQLDPYSQVGDQALQNVNFLNDGQAQMDYLQNNPIYKSMLDNANSQTQASAAARGRIGAGDTMGQLANNALVTGQTLVDSRKNDIMGQLGFGQANAAQIGGLQLDKSLNIGGVLGQMGDVEASGIVGYQNRQDAQRVAKDKKKSNTLSTIASVAGAFAAFSDINLKEDINFEYNKNGFNFYNWKWNKIAGEKLGLFGKSQGVIAQEVEKTNPELIISDSSGYKKVNYAGVL